MMPSMSSPGVVLAMCWFSCRVNGRSAMLLRCCANAIRRIRKFCLCIRGYRPRSRIGSSVVTVAAVWCWPLMWRRRHSPCRVSAMWWMRGLLALNAIPIAARSSSCRSKRFLAQQRANVPVVVAGWPMGSVFVFTMSWISNRGASSLIRRFSVHRWPALFCGCWI